MPLGFDCGTMFLCKAEMDESLNVIFSPERNAFLEVSADSDTEGTLTENHWHYAKHDGKYYIIGEDSIKLKNLLTIGEKAEKNIVATKVGELRRPMKDGILNTGEDKLSVAIIQKIIGNLSGKAKYNGEVLCFCSPGDPVDRNLSVVFHRTILSNFFKSLGYTVECIPEALAIIFSERPVAVDPETGEDAPFTGIALSYGSGMMNICFCVRKMALINFSVARSGDWIDQQSANTAGINVSAMTRYKEKHLDLDNVDYSDMRQAALDIYYQNMIEHSLNNFAAKFNQLDNKIDMPLEIVIAGGTAIVPGFVNKFNAVLKGMSLPFKVKNVRLADNPLYTVANGCLVKAISVENKLAENKETPVSTTSTEKEAKETGVKKIKLNR